MASIQIPPNDKTAPRWLLDLHEWRIQPYTEISKEILDSEGYGVVSYTWGYIAQWDKPATDLPEGVVWKVPTTSKWPLSKARDMMQKIGTRYIWWDWMCVPQVRECDDPVLYKAKGEEIGKQLHIYKKARKSIVWLHSTSWKGDSALKEILLLEMSRPHFVDPCLVEKYTRGVENWLKIAQKDERWLISGWTLQEGVLLGDTRLLDVEGNVMQDNRFCNGQDAVVRDLSIPISVLCHNLASAYFIQSEGHDPDPTRPGAGQFGHSLPKSPERVIWLRQSIKRLIESGLVGFFEFSPLFILAGKNSREYGWIEDSCWALIGAMELENIEVTANLSMEKIKRRFLSALLDRYQWMMLFLPFPESQIEKRQEGQNSKRPFRWTDIVDGALLPVHLFLVEDHVDPDSTAATQPTLHFSDANLTSERLLLKAPYRQKMRLCRVSKDHVTYFRHYRQDSDGLRIVSSRSISLTDDPLVSGGWLLPLWIVDTKGSVQGKRCLLLLQFKDSASVDQPARASFGGMIDVWGIGLETVEVTEMILDPCEK